MFWLAGSQQARHTWDQMLECLWAAAGTVEKYRIPALPTMNRFTWRCAQTQHKNVFRIRNHSTPLKYNMHVCLRVIKPLSALQIILITQCLTFSCHLHVHVWKEIIINISKWKTGNQSRAMLDRKCHNFNTNRDYCVIYCYLAYLLHHYLGWIHSYNFSQDTTIKMYYWDFQCFQHIWKYEI